MSLIYKQLFDIVAKKTRENHNSILFGFAILDLVKLVERHDNPIDWQNRNIDRDSAIQIYDAFAHILSDRALALANTSDDPIWNKVNEVLETIRKTLEEEGSVNNPGLEKIVLMSPSRQLEQAGFATVMEEPGGARFIQFTPLCNELARQFQEDMSKN